MKRSTIDEYREVALPWSDGTLSARLRGRRGRFACRRVLELGLHCYGANWNLKQALRLFTSLPFGVLPPIAYIQGLALAKRGFRILIYLGGLGRVNRK